MLANELDIERGTSVDDFDFTWEKDGELVVNGDNYLALCSSIKLVNCAVNNITQIHGTDNMREYLAQALNEMIDNKYVMEIELDRIRRGA